MAGQSEAVSDQKERRPIGPLAAGPIVHYSLPREPSNDLAFMPGGGRLYGRRMR